MTGNQSFVLIFLSILLPLPIVHPVTFLFDILGVGGQSTLAALIILIESSFFCSAFSSPLLAPAYTLKLFFGLTFIKRVISARKGDFGWIACSQHQEDDCCIANEVTAYYCWEG